MNRAGRFMDEAIQIELFQAGAELLTVDEDSARGRYSGAIIERNRERVRQIVRALAEGIGVHRVAKAFGVSVHTVLGIRDRHPDLIATEKQSLSRQLGRILKLSADSFEDALAAGKISPAQLPVAIGILCDKKAVLDGDASMIVRIEREEVPSVDDLTRRLQAMKRVTLTGVTLTECDSCRNDDNGQ